MLASIVDACGDDVDYKLDEDDDDKSDEGDENLRLYPIETPHSSF